MFRGLIFTASVKRYTVQSRTNKGTVVDAQCGSISTALVKLQGGGVCEVLWEGN